MHILLLLLVDHYVPNSWEFSLVTLHVLRVWENWSGGFYKNGQRWKKWEIWEGVHFIIWVCFWGRRRQCWHCHFCSLGYLRWTMCYLDDSFCFFQCIWNQFPWQPHPGSTLTSAHHNHLNEYKQWHPKWSEMWNDDKTGFSCSTCSCGKKRNNISYIISFVRVTISSRH